MIITFAPSLSQARSRATSRTSLPPAPGRSALQWGLTRLAGNGIVTGTSRMNRHSFIPSGVCPNEITLEIDQGILKKVTFEGGCNGNLQALGKLVEGMRAEEVIAKLKGIDCDGKGTSCSDQLAKALEAALQSTR